MLLFSRLLLAAALLTPCSYSAVTTLYDDTLGNTPGVQPWLFFGNDALLRGGSFTETAVAAGVQLLTDNPVSAGYGNYQFLSLKNPAFPLLDRNTGFSLSFELRLNSESHANNNRAGFSVILLGSDLMGIELGFWGDEIWAQSGADFLHAEGAVFDTTAAEVLYRLQILGSSYTLLANGNPILTNSLRNYSAFGLPYNLPNFLFLGDDTSSAGADITLGRVELDVAAVPEPASLTLIGLGLVAISLPGILRARQTRP